MLQQFLNVTQHFCILLTEDHAGIAAFEMEYGHWIEEESRQISELRSALNGHITDIELRILVEGGMNHYYELFRLKAAAAKSDVFYIMSGMWKTPAERFFFWIGGFRPSEVLKVMCLWPCEEFWIYLNANLIIFSCGTS